MCCTIRNVFLRKCNFVSYRQFGFSKEQRIHKEERTSHCKINKPEGSSFSQPVIVLPKLTGAELKMIIIEKKNCYSKLLLFVLTRQNH